MTLPDIIAVVVIALIVGAAAFYIIKAKRSGKKCIGCPDSSPGGKCSGSCSSCHSCAACCSHSTDDTSGIKADASAHEGE